MVRQAQFRNCDGMCVLAFAWRAHPRWQLLLAGNRDELHARPAAPLARWDGMEHVLAGRDLQSGGTWLGVSEQGRLAVVTNLRGHGGPEPGRASRGNLVTDALLGKGEGAADAGRFSDFNPFNLIVADAAQALLRSNREEPHRRSLASGLYGLSNGGLDEPWPKTLRLKSALDAWMAGPADQPDALLGALRADDPSGPPGDPALSPIFIRNPVYGTRCSTVVAIDSGGKGIMIERRYTAEGVRSGETALEFSWPA